jgi:putative flippase GtrA
MDALVYSQLFDILHPSESKACGFLAGSITAFILGRIFTFQSNGKIHKELGRFVVLYASTFFSNVAVHETFYRVGLDFGWIPFLAATAVSTVLNFLGQKYFVFREARCS